MAGQVLLQQTGERKSPTGAGSSARAWRLLGWFGLLLALIGLGDALVNWYPLAPQSPEWEFGTIATTFGSLPLVTMGLAALVASFLARGVRWGVITMMVTLLVLGLVVLGLFAVFATDIPLALRATAQTPARLAIRRGVLRTALLGTGFSVGYLAAAVMTFRYVKGGGRA